MSLSGIDCINSSNYLSTNRHNLQIDCNNDRDLAKIKSQLATIATHNENQASIHVEEDEQKMMQWGEGIKTEARARFASGLVTQTPVILDLSHPWYCLGALNNGWYSNIIYLITSHPTSAPNRTSYKKAWDLQFGITAFKYLIWLTKWRWGLNYFCH